MPSLDQSTDHKPPTLKWLLRWRVGDVPRAAKVSNAALGSAVARICDMADRQTVSITPLP